MAIKKYTVTVNADELVSVQVDGLKYNTVEEVPNPFDRSRLQRMVEAATDFSVDETGDFASRTSSSMAKIILPVFLGVALIMLAIAAISGVNTSRAIAREISAPGRVVSNVSWQDGQGDTLYSPVVAFTLPDNQISTVQMDTGSSSPSYEVGQQVTVLYDPDQPDQARIKSLMGNIDIWALTIITGVLGVAFLIAAGFAWWLLIGPGK